MLQMSKHNYTHALTHGTGPTPFLNPPYHCRNALCVPVSQSVCVGREASKLLLPDLAGMLSFAGGHIDLKNLSHLHHSHI